MRVGHEFEQFLKMSDVDLPTQAPCAVCNEMKVTQTLTALHLGDPFSLGLKKPDQVWRDYISRLKQKHPKGNINEYW